MEFRVKLYTRDGSLMMDRKADHDVWTNFGRDVDKHIRYMLAFDCREKGVTLLNYKLEPHGITAIVDYLK